MRLVQAAPADGPVRLGLLKEGRAFLLRIMHRGIVTTLDLLQAAEAGLDVGDWVASAEREEAFQPLPWDALANGALRGWRLACPVTPPEVWGCGVTYRRSADFREEGSGIYDGVYSADRPELFFKASAWRCAPPGGAIGARRDSEFTAAEPEVALVVGQDGRVLGYALANDVSAWDIERANPLYLPQSKIYRGCFSFGPVLVTPDEVPDPYALEITCSIRRGEREVFRGSAGTGQLRRRFPELVEWLLRSNEVRTGTVLSTGTGIIQPASLGLSAGDEVIISCPALGELKNRVELV